jgi:sugar lactone lactonase YvrE
MLKRTITTVAALLIAAAAYLIFWPVPINAVAWIPGPDRGMSGPFAPNDLLGDLELLAPGVGEGPEDVTRGPDGHFYSGLRDGRIVRFSAADFETIDVVATTGRPLGLQFDERGNLIVTDKIQGLLSIAPDGNVSVLADRVNGKRMLLVDDLDIAEDGAIWFSDASQRFDGHVMDFWEGRATGRLLRYDPQAEQTSVELEDLRFANGVALGPESTFVLVSETLGARITRLWLKGPKAGTRDIFLDALPGYPDNISYNGEGLFWVALAAKRVGGLERLAGRPFLREVLMRLPEVVRSAPEPRLGWIIGVDVEGNVRYNLQERTGRYAAITSVNEFDGQLYLGSLGMTAIGRAEVPRSPAPRRSMLHRTQEEGLHGRP